jgi:death-on-curing protein
MGLCESSVHRPQVTTCGEEAYPEFFQKAAALIHSLARNHCLFDSNKRLAWATPKIFCIMNGYDLVLNINVAEKIVADTGKSEFELPQLSEQLRKSRSYLRHSK